MVPFFCCGFERNDEQILVLLERPDDFMLLAKLDFKLGRRPLEYFLELPQGEGVGF